MNKIFICVIGFIILPSVVFAENSPDTTPKPLTPFTQETTHIQLSGYIDGSYNYLVNSNQFTSGSFNRVYDLTENGFTLQQAGLAITKQPEQGFGGLFNIILGRDANTTAAYGWNPNFGSQMLAIDPLQAFLQYRVDAITLVAGKFTTLASYEGVDPTQDNNFSRSILWGYATPTTVLGIRGTYVVNDSLKLVAGLNNGWDNTRDTSRQKTLELSIAYTPCPTISLSAQSYYGGQRAADKTATGTESNRYLIDLIAVWNATEKFTGVLNYDYGTQPKAALPSGDIAGAIWQGIAGYANCKIDDQWRISGRGEVFSDKNGYRTGIAQTWRELTFTIGYAPSKNMELRAEIRRDFSNTNAFFNSNEIGSTNFHQSYAFEGFYKFA